MRDNGLRSRAPSAALLALQQRAGNRAVVGLIQRFRDVQRAPWRNVPAKFRTDNDTEGAIPNSEYSVQETTYRRYAPINKYRAPGQVYHEGPRSFAYIPTSNAAQSAASAAATATVAADKIRLASKAKGQVVAEREPREGLVVWDADVADDGNVHERHVGHAVEDLGKALPTLDDPGKSEKARTRQASTKAAQEAGLLWSDKDLIEEMDALPEELSMAEVIADLKTRFGEAIKTARRGGAAPNR